MTSSDGREVPVASRQQQRTEHVIHLESNTRGVFLIVFINTAAVTRCPSERGIATP
jgi:hypothetical protein